MHLILMKLQQITYRYNIRGWLRSINNPDDLTNPIKGYTDDRFALRLDYYEQSSYNYNGNISEIEWRIHPSASGISQADEPSYTFRYDRANRLVRANYANPDGPANVHYTVFGTGASETSDGGTVSSGISYDANGNFLNLKRNNGGVGGSFLKEYEFVYNPGTNRLRNTDGSKNIHYQYDAAGNVIGNADRDIVTIHYDSRNLAHLIATETGFQRYSYDDPSAMLRTSADLRTAKYYRPDTQSSWALQTRYARGAFGEILAQYDGTQLQYWNILAAGGETLGYKAKVRKVH